MKIFERNRRLNLLVCTLLCLNWGVSDAQQKSNYDSTNYLGEVKSGLKKKFPDNRIYNIVFHGHSVPSGYWSHQEVHTLESYPHLFLKQLKAYYPYAMINIITTSKGGEHSVNGAKRFVEDALVHKPDVVVIDYALNDIGLTPDLMRMAWEKMIRECLRKNIKVVLMTPSPDQRINISKAGNKLEQRANVIRALAKKYKTGLADPFNTFQELHKNGDDLRSYMSGVNHPNEAGHQMIATALARLFIDE